MAPSRSDVVRVVLALASAGAGAIHLAVLPSHAHESALFGVFFLTSGLLQLLWALHIVIHTSRRLLVAGAVGNGLVIALWVVTRTTGLPFGPESGEPEPVDFVDGLATAYELVIVVGSLALLRRAPVSAGRVGPAGRRLALGFVAPCAVALTAVAVAGSDTDHQHEAGAHSGTGHREEAGGHEARSDIYLVALAGGVPKPLTANDEEQFAFNPAWSPDGRALAYTYLPCEYCPPEIRVLDVAGTVAERGRRRIASAADPAYSPDGRMLAFVGNGGRLMIVQADGSKRRALLRRATSAPVWSPDGSTIAFVANATDNRTHVFTSSATGRDLRQRTHGQTSEIDPAWAPHGRRLAFASQGPDGLWKIYVVDLAGGRAQRLTRGPGSETAPTWSPDAKRIAFVRQTPTDPGSLYVASVEDGNPRRVTDGSFAVLAPAWSPTDDAIAFVARAR